MAQIIRGVEFKKVNGTSIKLTHNHVSITATPTGLKFNAGTVQPAETILGYLPNKGMARKFRKALRAAGFKAHAAARKAS